MHFLCSIPSTQLKSILQPRPMTVHSVLIPQDRRTPTGLHLSACRPQRDSPLHRCIRIQRPSGRQRPIRNKYRTGQKAAHRSRSHHKILLQPALRDGQHRQSKHRPRPHTQHRRTTPADQPSLQRYLPVFHHRSYRSLSLKLSSLL